MTEAELRETLFTRRGRTQQTVPVPDWPTVHQELKRKGVTLLLLWTEFKKAHPKARQYSWFTQAYRQWAKKQDCWMHQPHAAGEEVYVDFSGLRVPIWTPKGDAVRFYAEIFVGVLGASDLVFCVATPNQQLPAWIDAHCQMFETYQGVSQLLIPDNLRSGITQAHRYDPLSNPTYQDMAQHYGCTILAARKRRPKDKAKAEKAVQSIQRQVLAPLRHERFTQLSLLNEAISAGVRQLNEKPFQKLPYSRQALFERIEQAALQPLPATRYQFAQWLTETVNGGYHIQVNQHYYSVPYTYCHQKIDIRVSQQLVECFDGHHCIARHTRQHTVGAYTTIRAHMPKAHQAQADCDEATLKAQAKAVGPATEQLITRLLNGSSGHQRKQTRRAQGILRLARREGSSPALLEKACQQALRWQTINYRLLEALVREPLLAEPTPTAVTQHHDNIRGQDDFN